MQFVFQTPDIEICLYSFWNLQGRKHVVTRCLTSLYPFSDKDPGGLLLLPEKSDLASTNTSEVLAVMNTLLSVAAREVPSDSPPVVFTSCFQEHS